MVRAPERRLPSPSPTSSRVWCLRRTRRTRPSSSRVRRGAVSFTCKLDDLTPEACTSPWTHSPLAEGSHSFSVQAEDGVSPPSEPAPWTWTVDLTPPSLQGQDRRGDIAAGYRCDVLLNTNNFDPTPGFRAVRRFLVPSSISGRRRAWIAWLPMRPWQSVVGIVHGYRRGHDAACSVAAQGRDRSGSEFALGGGGAQYNLPLATDNGDRAPLVGCSTSSGSIFQVGTTKVTCSAVDASGNHSASRRFDVVVQHGPTPAVPLLTSNIGALTNDTNVDFSFETTDGPKPDCKLDSPSGPGTFASWTPASRPTRNSGTAATSSPCPRRIRSETSALRTSAGWSTRRRRPRFGRSQGRAS